ncbi:hypothetical protein [Actinoplanes sp. HUAS TT8]|uniref:hypothetical protein n=1 Tax=Actinoplanes sp. HUAS TT8 TaxID=3447453 RepID=UPI003F51B9FB
MNRVQSLLTAGIGLMAAVALGAGASSAVSATPAGTEGAAITTGLHAGVLIQPQPLPPGDRAA